MSQQEKVTTAEALWALKTAASDYSFASADGTPQLFQNMFPGDVSANFTMSRTKMSYLIANGLGPFFRQKLCQDISKSSFGYAPFSMMRQEIHKAASSVTYWFAIGQKKKNEISVRFLKTLFFWACQRS